ncbi:hypothetical protein L226DRAFT_338284 [Lentinus tigrinus ALCF2SS1-7]|uniref:uncharacterized protein n=1 Tax=Lentinus tigrinus ALCF2SS1-7 TaxID=1328758 RepID=UPI0011661332|nr:hypothetical protein L226DRAFT_338284 [Lentinus tigrinus ALCF2SS1-7]
MITATSERPPTRRTMFSVSSSLLRVSPAASVYVFALFRDHRPRRPQRELCAHGDASARTLLVVAIGTTRHSVLVADSVHVRQTSTPSIRLLSGCRQHTLRQVLRWPQPAGLGATIRTTSRTCESTPTQGQCEMGTSPGEDCIHRCGSRPAWRRSCCRTQELENYTVSLA